MITNKNILLVFVQWLLIIISVVNKNKQAPGICPQCAKMIDKISSCDTAKERSNNYKWKDQEHDPDKKDHGINTIKKTQNFNE